MSINSSSSSSTKTNKSNNTTVEEILSKFNIKHTSHIETLIDSNLKNKHENDDDDDELNHPLDRSQDECSLSFDIDTNNNLLNTKNKLEETEQINFLPGQIAINESNSRGLDLAQGKFLFHFLNYPFAFFLLLKAI
jgi:hypothetical protein